jgi:DNA cross-link repair 1A protein
MTPSSKRLTQTKLSPAGWGNKNKTNGGTSGTKLTKAKTNGNILNFFKKSDVPPGMEQGLFLESKNGIMFAEENGFPNEEDEEEQEQEPGPGSIAERNIPVENRFNEDCGSVKRRKINIEGERNASSPVEEDSTKRTRRVGPFLDGSDSEDEEPSAFSRPTIGPGRRSNTSGSSEDSKPPKDEQKPVSQANRSPPRLFRQDTSLANSNEEFFHQDEYLPDEDFEEDLLLQEQRKLELAENGIFEEADSGIKVQDDTIEDPDAAGPTCPICNVSLLDATEQQAAIHVNNCLDGKPTELPTSSRETEPTSGSNDHKKFMRPPKPGQPNPASLQKTPGKESAFSRLMSGHAEDAAWASAAAEETASRGKPSYQRTCPFYKILPGFSICVDAFRYGAVEGCNAYFLSHFHSDHYIGLTASWKHGPIYCSKVTGNLVRQQLRVDPKFVIDLEFEETQEIPHTDGVTVTMIPANHCPGSSLFLFEKAMGRGPNPYKRRVLHCGDFRACRAHVEHPLLRPDVQDLVSGKSKEQKIDVCYLDTTYLNPRYAFPSQDDVMEACAERCVAFNDEKISDDEVWTAANDKSAANGMAKFVRKETGSNAIKSETSETESSEPTKGRLLVVVGTYSIGKERICLSIARAMKSKIYATPSKQRICACLEDPELNSLLTSDPREAQVHMTPLGEIRPETLAEYLSDYRDSFDRAVAFRPSGWNYRPPVNRSLDTVTVPMVLANQGSWKSAYTAKDLVPQRGSTKRVMCFGVPYSEHSSFRELTMFCCALKIDRIIPTVNVGSSKSRERMKGWCEKWAAERKKNGLFRPTEDGW